jgi:hypothetical protein
MDMTTFVVLTIAFGCIGAGIGKWRGRPWLGFFLGAALNVVGWCISAVLPKPAPQPPPLPHGWWR